MPQFTLFKKPHNVTFLFTNNEFNIIRAQCANFNELDVQIMEMSEEHLLHCLAVEHAGQCRFNIINRLYARYNNVRKNREKLEVFAREPA